MLFRSTMSFKVVGLYFSTHGIVELLDISVIGEAGDIGKFTFTRIKDENFKSFTFCYVCKIDAVSSLML